ncbi:MAG: tRNA (N6-threonylcarbamoyladenosine(37)-N6)-methyltransferase TrmO [Candidatus Aenigmarchaeota archaeon]|nr:tRNA (N6-threonylcarbamoyladenosine(37)-N6)-methyltransferase TrmO [Candidatus Aenigmarchaeota archaeon]MDI6722873.1 tRNA (N6-threonylcarbamoyladenosine(37)-N6)-methyltransferase TrmO [Candidatus Aenigmarchaeota archaeon]
MKISLKPVGIVKNREKDQHFGGWDKVVSEVIVDRKLSSALDGLEGYSHAVIVYWMHKVKKRVIKHRPQGIGPLVGIFACRCQGRPNPIGISAVKIVRRRKNVLTVKGLDVISGTPVLDIKPYTPRYDMVKDAKVPEWTKMLKY